MWIKICGIRDLTTALDVAELAPNAIGLNFYHKTPRCVSIDTAARIVHHLPEAVDPVGLFVNHSIDQITATCQQSGIRTVQLHGDEPPQLLAQLSSARTGIRIVHAHRLGLDGLDPLSQYVEECAALKGKLAACLIDARIEGAYGGTGTTVPWDLLNRQYRRIDWPPLILAGGLNPENVGDAIRIARPWGVDVSSGVESVTAIKDMRLVKKFINTARCAFEQVTAGDTSSLDSICDL